jgi:hypothetical protein
MSRIVKQRGESEQSGLYLRPHLPFPARAMNSGFCRTLTQSRDEGFRSLVSPKSPVVRAQRRACPAPRLPPACHQSVQGTRGPRLQRVYLSRKVINAQNNHSSFTATEHVAAHPFEPPLYRFVLMIFRDFAYTPQGKTKLQKALHALAGRSKRSITILNSPTLSGLGPSTRKKDTTAS